MTGYDKFKQNVDKLKTEVVVEKIKEEKIMEEVKQSIELIKANPELMKMYQDNANVGAENLGGELPILKVHSMGKSRGNITVDGIEPAHGSFFHKTTRKAYSDVYAHILVISRGFYAKNIEEGKDDKWNQIIGGLITNDGENSMTPFVMFVSGLRLQHLWDFGKEAAKWTKAKPVSIPMYALTVHMTTEEVTHAKSKQYGNALVVKYEIYQDESGNPALVYDPQVMKFLRDSYDEMKGIIDGLVENKAIGAIDEPIPSHFEAETVAVTEEAKMPF